MAVKLPIDRGWAWMVLSGKYQYTSKLIM